MQQQQQKSSCAFLQRRSSAVARPHLWTAPPYQAYCILNESSPLSACILLCAAASWLMSWARSPSLGPGGMLGDRPSRAWFMDRPLWCAAGERGWQNRTLGTRVGRCIYTKQQHHLSVLWGYKETYVSCLRSFLCGLGSWTHCCCGETMGDCLASCGLLRRAQGRDCPAHVPVSPAATETNTNPINIQYGAKRYDAGARELKHSSAVTFQF